MNKGADNRPIEVELREILKGVLNKNNYLKEA
jgi:hypothetical protein